MWISKFIAALLGVLGVVLASSLPLAAQADESIGPRLGFYDGLPAKLAPLENYVFTGTGLQGLPDSGFAMCQDGPHVYLAPTQLSATMPDEDPESWGYPNFIASGCQENGAGSPWAFLASDTVSLEPGPITTFMSAEPNRSNMSLSARLRQIAFTLGETPYTFTLGLAGQNPSDESCYQQQTLTLTASGKTQTLLDLHDDYGILAGVSFAWMGDLDRDQQPDFLIEYSLNDRTAAMTLFLSSLAASDQLVAPTATYVAPVF